MINININSKVYYLKKNGNVIVITPEYSTNFYSLESDLKDDYEKYEQLQEFNIDEIDFIKLEFGIFNSKLLNTKRYYVDLKTKELVVTYYTNAELEEMNKEDIKVSIDSRVETLEEENANMLLDLIEKTIRIEQLENDLADILLSLGGE